MALNNTYFETKGRDITNPIPETPGYVPPIVPTPPTPGSGSVPVIPRPTYQGNVNITLYDCNSDRNVMDKQITQVDNLDIVIKDPCDLVRPYIILNGTYECNYMYMLGRYYYVTCEALPGNLTGLRCKSDPLMSFKTSIRTQSGIIERNAGRVNTYIPDDLRKVTAYKTSHKINFSGSFSKTLNYYLLTTGNGSSAQPT